MVDQRRWDRLFKRLENAIVKQQKQKDEEFLASLQKMVEDEKKKTNINVNELLKWLINPEAPIPSDLSNIMRHTCQLPDCKECQLKNVILETRKEITDFQNTGKLKPDGIIASAESNLRQKTQNSDKNPPVN